MSAAPQDLTYRRGHPNGGPATESKPRHTDVDVWNDLPETVAGVGILTRDKMEAKHHPLNFKAQSWTIPFPQKKIRFSRGWTGTKGEKKTFLKKTTTNNQQPILPQPAPSPKSVLNQFVQGASQCIHPAASPLVRFPELVQAVEDLPEINEPSFTKPLRNNTKMRWFLYF